VKTKKKNTGTIAFRFRQVLLYLQKIFKVKKTMSNRVTISFVYTGIAIKLITETYLTKF